MAPNQTIDYDALAKQAGAVQSVDYDALARQAGATSSKPAAKPTLNGPTGGTSVSAAPSPKLVSINPADLIPGPEGGIGGSPIGNPIHVDTSAIENYTPEGRAEHPILSRLGDVTKGVKELLYGGKEAGKPMGTSSGVLNNPVTVAMSLAPGAAEAGSALKGMAGDALAARKASKAAEAANEIGEVTEGHFTKAKPTPTPQHGTPVANPQPLDNATINRMPGGKDLSPEAIKTLKQHIGGTPGQEIETGSSVKNTVMKAVEPVQKTLTETGIKMNKIINDAPSFQSSIASDGKFGSEISNLRDNLPGGVEETLNKTIDKELANAQPVLSSTDPAEILAYRRKLGNQINWNDITNTPETVGEVQNLTKVKLYRALGDKIHEIPGTAELDKVFQPNLELQSHLDAKLGKAVSRDPVEANAQQLSEFNKGKAQLAAAAHDAKVARNWDIVKKVLSYAGGGALAGGSFELAKHIMGE